MRCECTGYGDCHKKHEFPVSTSHHPIRAFDPNWNEKYRGNISDILGICPHCDDYALRVKGRYGSRSIDCGADAIFIDGACRNNGRHGARAAIANYYGPESPRNCSLRLVRGPITSQNAEIQAAIMAIEDVIDNDPHENRRLCKLLVITDSKYLVDGISKWIWRWKRNDWTATSGAPVSNKRAFKELDRLVNVLEDRGTDVWFWHVSRDLNREADRMAKGRLDD